MSSPPSRKMRGGEAKSPPISIQGKERQSPSQKRKKEKKGNISSSEGEKVGEKESRLARKRVELHDT